MTDQLVPTTPHPELDELIAVLEKLRAPGGCVWDREQTHASLVQYLVEETFELVDAIEAGEREIVMLATTAAQVNLWARTIQALGCPPQG